MRLLSLELYNFRPFYGLSETIQFAQSDQRNVTVIIGNNGCGKTGLLNALTWVLYEKFSDALSAPEHLVNRRAIREASVGEKIQCWVQLNFDHQARKYRIKRIREVKKTDEEGNYEIANDNVLLESAGEDGRWQKIEEVIATINRILPEDLHRYFFFDGERIENLQRPDKKKEIASATTKLNGEEVLNRAISHLDRARQSFEANLRKIGDIEIQDLLDEKQQLEEDKDQISNAVKLYDDNLAGLAIEKGKIEDLMQGLKAVETLQKRRKELNDLHKHYEESLLKTRQDLSSLISNNAYKVFLPRAVQVFQNKTRDLKAAGELPTAIKSPFVQGLLDHQKCICGRELIPGEKAYQEVSLWKDRCGFSEVEAVIFRMEGEAEQINNYIPEFFVLLDQLQKERRDLREKICNIESELEDIKEELRKSPEQEARDYQDKLDELEKLMDQEKEARVLSLARLNPLEEKVNEIERQINKRKGLNDEQERVLRRIRACMTARNRIDEVRSRLRARFRQDLGNRIERIFSSISFKPYKPVLSEDYTLQLMESDQSMVTAGASTAENQVLSLAFIGGIIDQAREFTAQRDLLPGPDSSVFPMVMDAAFGNLDPIYRSNVARRIPELANQVIILVNKSQWQDEVAKNTAARIGKQYIISYQGPREDITEDSIELAGISYPLVKHRLEEVETSEIVEVSLHG